MDSYVSHILFPSRITRKCSLLNIISDIYFGECEKDVCNWLEYEDMLKSPEMNETII